MELLAVLSGVAIGAAGGGVLAWMAAVGRSRTRFESALRGAEALAAAASATADTLRGELDARLAEVAELRDKLESAANSRSSFEARADEMNRRFAEQQRLLAQAEEKLSSSFRALAADALKASGESFLTLAAERFNSLQRQSAADLDARRAAIGGLLEPVRESLTSLDRELRRIENERHAATEILTDQLKSLSSQTNRLVDALKTPSVRGRWGEIQLRRVVEIAGMSAHCDFTEQAQVTSDEGRFRPDMTVRLPGGKQIVIDAKVPLQAYMEALDAEGETMRLAKLQDHARQVRYHVSQLSAKAYWDALESAPEFVVLFLPGEMFFSAALQQDGNLIEDAAAARVVLATPTTLIALLKAVSYGWRQEQLAENAERIGRLGQDLHDRIVVMRDHFARIGGALGGAVRSFNDAVGSFQSRVMPAARRFRELGAVGKDELRDIEPVDSVPREISTTIAEDGRALAPRCK